MPFLNLNSFTYPDNKVDFGLGWSAAKELKSSCNIHWSNLIKVILLILVLLSEVLEHSVQILLLNGLDLNGLEDLGWTSL